MLKWKLIAAIALTFAVAEYGWVHAQPAKAPKFTADDYIQIQQLYANYAHALDKGQGERMADLFVPDGEFTGGRAAGHGNDPRNPAKGREALVALGSHPGTRHFTSNLVITPTADGARGSCYLMLYIVRTIPGFLSETSIYDDILVKTPQGWKFKKRTVWRDDDDLSPYKPPAGMPIRPAGR